MSNDITRAIRKLRGLKEDVERLKSARDEEGEVRLLRLVTDRTVVTDRVEAVKDAIVTDETVVTDSVSASTDTTQPAYHGEARHGIDHHSET